MQAPEEISIIGYMRSPLIPSSLHLCQTLREKRGTKEDVVEWKQECGERERERDPERTERAMDRKDTTNGAKEKARSASLLKQLRAG